MVRTVHVAYQDNDRYHDDVAREDDDHWRRRSITARILYWSPAPVASAPAYLAPPAAAAARAAPALHPAPSPDPSVWPGNSSSPASFSVVPQTYVPC